MSASRQHVLSTVHILATTIEGTRAVIRAASYPRDPADVQRFAR